MNTEAEIDTDITSPTTQRRMWRRVWISLVVFVLLMPVLLWVAIDQGGKREWRRVQAELRANGEATTFAELNLPTREQVPDGENFCAIPWLMANADGSESAAMAEVTQSLRLFTPATNADPDVHSRLNSAVMAGFPTDLAAWNESVSLQAEEMRDSEEGIEIPTEGTDAEKMLAALEREADLWRELASYGDRPMARFLPLYGERLGSVSNPATVNMVHLNAAMTLVKALRLRMLAAVNAGDVEIAVQSFEAAMRLVEAGANEPNLIGLLVMNTISSMLSEALMECFWAENFRSSNDALERCAAALNRIDFYERTAFSLRSEAVFCFEITIYLADHRSEIMPTPFGDENESQTAVQKLAPTGWYLGNLAYFGGLLDRSLFAAMRGTGDSEFQFPLLLLEARDMIAEVDGLSDWQRFNRHLVLESATMYEKILQKACYPAARHRLALIVCALYQYRIEHGGKFPAELGALVPNYLKAVPLDPIDGMPMRYSLADEADGGFRLYSIGIDGIDGGGKLNLDPDRPAKTRFADEDYLGDWPWPVVPVAEQGGSSEAGAKRK